MQKIFSSVYLTCRNGSEKALKAETLRIQPDWRFSYSRSGFSTWLLPEQENADPMRFRFRQGNPVFARSVTLGMGKVSGEKPSQDQAMEAITPSESMIRDFWTLCREARADSRFPRHRVSRIHVWQREAQPLPPGEEPGVDSFAKNLFKRLYESAPEEFRSGFAADADRPDAPGKFNELCLDCIIDSPNLWWVGLHKVHDEHSRYPGGLFNLPLPHDAVSRAWLKFEEGIRWSGFPIEPESRCVDIGSAPGGGSQALLSRGAFVLGVDPAEMDPLLLAHPNFTHARGKVGQIKRKLFRKARWFITDMNVAPAYTLDALEELVLRPDVAARGLLFTLKLFQWNLAEQIPLFVQRIQSWGFNQVRVRQLQFNHQEVMVAALKKPFIK